MIFAEVGAESLLHFQPETNRAIICPGRAHAHTCLLGFSDFLIGATRMKLGARLKPVALTGVIKYNIFPTYSARKSRTARFWLEKKGEIRKYDCLLPNCEILPHTSRWDSAGEKDGVASGYFGYWEMFWKIEEWLLSRSNSDRRTDPGFLVNRIIVRFLRRVKREEVSRDIARTFALHLIISSLAVECLIDPCCVYISCVYIQIRFRDS